MEIEFRGKRKDNGEWVEGYLFELRLDNSFRMAIQNYSVNEVIAETIGQYTGLKDKNGVKIFEGDILDGYQYDENKIFVVTFLADEYSCGFVGMSINLLSHIHIWYRGLKVIGNKWDNIDLMEVGK